MADVSQAPPASPTPPPVVPQNTTTNAVKTPVAPAPVETAAPMPSTKEEWKATIVAYLQEQEQVLVKNYLQKLETVQQGMKRLEESFAQQKAELESRFEQIEKEIEAKREEQKSLQPLFEKMKMDFAGKLDDTNGNNSFHQVLQEFHMALDKSFFKEKREEFLGKDSQIRQMCFELYKLGESEEVVKGYVRQAEEIWTKVQDIEINRTHFLREFKQRMKRLKKTFRKAKFSGKKGFWARLFGK
ncbi:hypothetical protein K9L63_00805 [Candidatus Gracilibacteria bacterium]|nr:hypothetical protein [Candidatus Gracilibacteria bacterium]